MWYQLDVFGSSNPYGTVRSYCDGDYPSARGANSNEQIGYFCPALAYSARKNAGEDCKACKEGNPIHPAVGNKFQREDDYAAQGLFPLRFVRYYNSRISVDSSAAIGVNWSHTYSRKLLYDTGLANPIPVGAVREDGKEIPFNLVNGVYVPDRVFNERLERITGGWKLTNLQDEVELYDNSGRLISITNRAGLVQTLAYNAAGRLASVTDPFGRTLSFTYDSRSRIQTMTAPGGLLFQYTYTSENLTRVTYPDTTFRTYHYENATYPNHLTGITDENGSRYSTYAYDASGLANLTQLAGGVGKVTTVNSDVTTAPRQITVTRFVSGSQSASRTYTYSSIVGVAVNTAISSPACPSCGPPSRFYDTNGNIFLENHWNGARTHYQSYDLTRNLETQRSEGQTAGGLFITNVTRIIATQWHPAYRLPTGIAQPFRITTMAYGDPTDPNPGNRGSLLSRTIQATTSSTGGGFGATPTGTPRTWTYTYNGNGSVLTVNGPRTDVPDITTYTYYANNATCPGANAAGCRGQIETITNAAGHLTSITEYNAHGQPLTIVDPNGLTTTLSYDLRQRLTSRSVGSETTTYTYDNAGRLTRVTLPDGSFLSYTYDAAYRLTQISDNLGNRVSYTLDLAGNRTQERVFDPANQLAQTRSRVYNNLNRLIQEIGATGQTTTFGYDDQGNVTSLDGPLTGTADVTSNTYDLMNRLSTVTDPLSGRVTYGYNSLDQLTSVTDPRGLVTTYSYNGLGNLNQQVSPDTGTTVNTYDTAGNLLTQTDAKGQVTTHAYDALNRVIQITFHDGARQTYAYDQGANSRGRLSSITETDPASQVTSLIQYQYDAHGRITAETRTVNGIAYVTGYTYDTAGRLTGMTYPSGRQVSYALDSLGRIGEITTARNLTTATVLSSAAYRPFGPVQSFALGNGQSYTRGFDQDGRIASYTLGTQTFAVGYDFASRVSFISDAANPANTNTYSYDNLDRLTNASLPGTPFAYSYDAVGNRLSKTVGAATDTYTPGSTSNRLASVQPASGPLRNFQFDANGATTNDAVNQYGYDTRGRLTQSVSVLGTTSYQLNALGQRVRKTNTQADTVYHYDTQGRLIAETNAAGTVQKEYLYLGDIPVAVIQ